MLRPLALPLAATLLLAARAAGQVDDAPAGRYDNQWRPEVAVGFPVAPRLDASVAGQLQLGQRAGGLVQARVGGTLQLAARPWLSLAAGYQHFSSRPPGGERVTEHRPSGAATLRASLPGRFGLQGRILVELRDREGARSVRYRNRLTLERRSRLGRRDLRLYLSEEPYYDSRYGAWVRNQVSLGGVASLGPHLATELYVMRQDDDHARPGDLVIVGTVVRVR